MRVECESAVWTPLLHLLRVLVADFLLLQYVGDKGPKDSPFLYILTFQCERSPRELSRHTFAIFLAPIQGVIGIYITSITFGHWPCVNMPKWPKSRLSIRIDFECLIMRHGTLSDLSVLSIFLNSFLYFLSPHTTTLGAIDHAIKSLSIGMKAREFHCEEFVSLGDGAQHNMWFVWLSIECKHDYYFL